MKPFRQDLIPWVSRAVLGALFVITLGAMVRQGMLDGIPLWEAAVNISIISIPLLLVFFAADMLVEALEQHFLVHRLSRRMGAMLRWTPRIGMLLFAAFISLFALDIFGQGYSLWETVVGLTMHLLPTFLLLATLALAWRWPAVGGVLVLAVAAVFLVWFGPGWAGMWFLYLLMIGPLVVTGLLFLADWWLRGEVQQSIPPAPTAA
jgi:hypothetical protein